jgi:hypothetical protein
VFLEYSKTTGAYSSTRLSRDGFASPNALAKRTWQQAIDTLVESKYNSTKARWQRSVKHSAFDLIRQRPLIETHAEHFLAVLKAGTVSTNLHLRQIQNYGLDLNWLPRPIIPRRQWASGLSLRSKRPGRLGS